jgi:hypothetical protein
MHNNEERFAVTAGLACLCGVGGVAAIVPVVGYVLLGLVALGVVGLITGGAVLWWRTRIPPTPSAVRETAVPAGRVRQEVA